MVSSASRRLDDTFPDTGRAALATRSNRQSPAVPGQPAIGPAGPATAPWSISRPAPVRCHSPTAYSSTKSFVIGRLARHSLKTSRSRLSPHNVCGDFNRGSRSSSRSKSAKILMSLATGNWFVIRNKIACVNLPLSKAILAQKAPRVSVTLLDIWRIVSALRLSRFVGRTPFVDLQTAFSSVQPPFHPFWDESNWPLSLWPLLKCQCNFVLCALNCHLTS